jgi:hypothetical protein
MTNGTIVLAGALAQKPRQAGHTWVFLQYLLGFRRLGWDVLFLDRLEPRMCRDEHGVPCPPESSIAFKYASHVMDQFGLGNAYAVAFGDSRTFVGVPREDVLARVSGAAMLLNVMGFLDDAEILAAARRRVFLDIDPGFGQMWCDLGLHDAYEGYDDFVTIGENIGRPDCAVPVCGRSWITTRPPVVLDHWRLADRAPGGSFTSVGAWRSAYAPVEYKGRSFGLRAHEFRKFATLPTLTRERFEVALDIHPADSKDRTLLTNSGWNLVDPSTVACDPVSYRAYLGTSKAEFMIAKNMYVQSRSGWFSDRTACYLASGKPVAVQDTGLTDLYPLGEGIIPFSTLDDALSAVDAIAGGYEQHCRAARRLAETYFDSDIVLQRLCDRLSL